MAAELDAELDDGAVVVGVLKGCLPFLADLTRRIDTPIEMDFLALTAFAPDSGRVRLTHDLTVDVEGRQVVLVEGVVDTGFRLDYLLRHVLATVHPRSGSAPCSTGPTGVYCHWRWT